MQRLKLAKSYFIIILNIYSIVKWIPFVPVRREIRKLLSTQLANWNGINQRITQLGFLIISKALPFGSWNKRCSTRKLHWNLMSVSLLTLCKQLNIVWSNQVTLKLEKFNIPFYFSSLNIKVENRVRKRFLKITIGALFFVRGTRCRCCDYSNS